MSAPNYDWLKQLNTKQREYIQDKYPSIYNDYVTYGYNVLLTDWNQKLDEIYDEVKDISVITKVDLPSDTQEAVRKLQRVHHDMYNLNNIVVPVQDYHIALLSDSIHTLTELQSKLTTIPVVTVNDMETEVFHCKNVAVVIDDITMRISEELLENLELYAIPFIRRSIAGWKYAYIDSTTLDILANFVERFRPCKEIR